METLDGNFGPHLLAELRGCQWDATQERNVRWFLESIVDVIGMKAIGKVHMDKYHGDKAWHGYSATIHIQTSHVTAHFFDETGFVFLDIFSCRPFDVDHARDHIVRVLQPNAHAWQLLQRGALFPPEVVE